MKRETDNPRERQTSSAGGEYRSFDEMLSLTSDPYLREKTYRRLQWIETGTRTNERLCQLLYEAGLPDEANKLYLCRSSFDLETFQGMPQTVASSNCKLTHLCQFCAWQRGNDLYRKYKEVLEQMLSSGYGLIWLTVNAKFSEFIGPSDLNLFKKNHADLMHRKVMKPVRGCLRFIEIEFTNPRWLLHAHSILFVDGEIQQGDVAKSWSRVNSDPSAVHIRFASPAELRTLILYGCKPHPELRSVAALKSYLESTRGSKMVISGGAALRVASAITRRKERAKRSKRTRDASDHGARHKILSNINSRSDEFQELLRKVSPEFAEFAEVL